MATIKQKPVVDTLKLKSKEPNHNTKEKNIHLISKENRKR
jgi:hypothetical protein